MRTLFIALSTALLAASCTTAPSENVEMSVQDPCMTRCTSLFNRCVEDSAGDASMCNEDRSSCEQECRADDATEEEGEGVITTE